MDENKLKLGAKNLVTGCFSDVFGKTVLIVAEDPTLGWYDAAAPASVETALEEMGAKVKTLIVGAPKNRIFKFVQAAIDSVDEVIFFARIGDQGRFKFQYDSPHSVMSYALNAEMLAGGYGTLNHSSMVALKDAIDDVTLTADNIRVTCPLGTDFMGSPGNSLLEGSEVVVSRYPMGVPKPVLAEGFSGVVKLTHFLTPTGSKVYKPAYLQLSDVVTVLVDGTRMVDMVGPTDLVRNFRLHYEQVATKFGLKAFNVDSWHAGIHPLMKYDSLASSNPVRWSQSVFASPRILHFHTCGIGPPGEICWMIVDPTITIDGVNLWENGRLRPERFQQTRQVLELDSDLAMAFLSPADAIGLDEVVKN